MARYSAFSFCAWAVFAVSAFSPLGQSGRAEDVPTDAAPPAISPSDETLDILPEQDEATVETGDQSPDNAPPQDEAQPQVTADGTEIFEERYASGAVKVSREVVQDSDGNYINHGKWKLLDTAGNAIAMGQYRYTKRHGKWSRWYRRSDAEIFSQPPYKHFTGPFLSETKFEDDRLSGAWTIHDAQGHKISRLNFVDGKRHGTATWWHPSGDKMRETFYFDGVIAGDFVEWDNNSRVVTTDTYYMGRKVAPRTEYYSPGKKNSQRKKKSQGTYMLPKLVVKTPDDWWNAKFAEYMSEGEYLKHGRWASWHPNGKLSQSGQFKSNAPTGTFSWWYPDGQKGVEGSYKDGKTHGSWTWWHQNGQKKVQAEYDEGVPIGHWTWWDEKGEIALQTDLSEADGLPIDLPLVPQSASAAEPGLLPNSVLTR